VNPKPVGASFSWLKSRNLRGVELVVSDDHGGLVKAVRRYFQGVTWHRCQTHFMRNIMDATPKSAKEELYPHLRAILDAPDYRYCPVVIESNLGDI
jgi:putative transposase